MTVQPIKQSIEVKASPARAFELFTRRIGRWWPAHMSIGASPRADIVIEPRPGGRWFERAADGRETQWGTVLAWEPPGRLLLGWQIDTTFKFAPDLITEVELTFAPTADGGTQITLEHRNLERFGANAEGHAERLRGGWPAVLGGFLTFAHQMK